MGEVVRKRYDVEIIPYNGSTETRRNIDQPRVMSLLRNLAVGDDMIVSRVDDGEVTWDDAQVVQNSALL